MKRLDFLDMLLALAVCLAVVLAVCVALPAAGVSAPPALSGAGLIAFDRRARPRQDHHAPGMTVETLHHPAEP